MGRRMAGRRSAGRREERDEVALLAAADRGDASVLAGVPELLDGQGATVRRQLAGQQLAAG